MTDWKRLLNRLESVKSLVTLGLVDLASSTLANSSKLLTTQVECTSDSHLWRQAPPTRCGRLSASRVVKKKSDFQGSVTSWMALTFLGVESHQRYSIPRTSSPYIDFVGLHRHGFDMVPMPSCVATPEKSRQASRSPVPIETTDDTWERKSSFSRCNNVISHSWSLPLGWYNVQHLALEKNCCLSLSRLITKLALLLSRWGFGWRPHAWRQIV